MYNDNHDLLQYEEKLERKGWKRKENAVHNLSFHISASKVFEHLPGLMLTKKFTDRPHQHQNSTARVQEDSYVLSLYFELYK